MKMHELKECMETYEIEKKEEYILLSTNTEWSPNTKIIENKILFREMIKELDCRAISYYTLRIDDETIDFMHLGRLVKFFRVLEELQK